MAVHQHDTEAEGVPQLGPAGRDAGELWDSPISTKNVVFFGSNGISLPQGRSTRLENVDLYFDDLR